MGFLRRLFGKGDEKGEYRDEQGIYFYVECDNCGAKVRVRADKKYDLNRGEDGFTWHKTIVDSKCFRPISAVVQLDHNYNITHSEIEGGHFISQAEYEAPAEPVETPDDEDEGAEDESAGDAPA